MGLPAADSAPREGREVCVCTRVHVCVAPVFIPFVCLVDFISFVLSLTYLLPETLHREMTLLIFFFPLCFFKIKCRYSHGTMLL